MRLRPVNSSSLAAVGYDAESQVLAVKFRHGGIYEYFDVPKRAYKELMTASSLGEYFARNIRGSYRYAKR
jgi:hypothetical protein